VINVRYPAERKEAILQKMAPPMSLTIPELAEQEGITTAISERIHMHLKAYQSGCKAHGYGLLGVYGAFRRV